MKEQEKIEVVNEILSKFPQQIRLAKRGGCFYVTFFDIKERRNVEKRWQLAGGSAIFPPWASKISFGAVWLVAISQLLRWLQGKPVMPIIYFYQLAKLEDGLITLDDMEKLISCGYPMTSRCVCCGRPLRFFFSWFKGLSSGPVCRAGEGCRVMPKERYIKSAMR